MGDSDDEFDRKKGRDKFRNERNDYGGGGRRNDDRRRDNWEDRRPPMRGGGGGGGMRPQQSWGGGRGGGGPPRDRMYQRPYDDRRRERFSPGRYDGGPPNKRMRRDWDDGGGNYESPFQVRDGPPGYDRGGWNNRGHESRDGPPGRGGGDFSDRHGGPEPDHPCQPAMMSFKSFLNKQDDHISQDEAIRLFEEYKLDFKRQQINEFFLQHKEEEWFKSKYHPDEYDKRMEGLKNAVEARRQVWQTLREKGFYDGVNVHSDSTNKLTKIMDATVIMLEGGNDLDLTILDAPPEEPQSERKRVESESASAASAQPKPSDNGDNKDKSDGEDGELSDTGDKKEVDEDKDKGSEKKEPTELSMDTGPEQEALKRQAEDFTKQKEEAKAQRRKRKKKKDSYSYDSDSGSASSDSDSESEPNPPGMDEDLKPPGTEPTVLPPVEEKKDEDNEAEAKTNGEKEDDNKEKEEGEEKKDEEKPRPLHRTNSIFLRNLAPNITKQEVEAMCRRFPGFIRVALQDPQPERRFMRRGWVTFSKDCNIKEVCWNLSNIRLRDSELGATLNRQLQQRVRAANGLTEHKPIMRNDIKMAAKIIQVLDRRWGLWEDQDGEKKDTEKQPQFGFVSGNPVLKNITDFLVEEGSWEEEELLAGMPADPAAGDASKAEDGEVTIDKDPAVAEALDRMVLYLRLVHSMDYYAANEYPNEDEMPHRCGIMHARGTSTAKITQTDVNDWMAAFERKMKPFMEAEHRISDKDAVRLGRKDPETEVEKFVQANTQELSKDKWLCPISGKKFKGPDFIRKHIFNKQQDKVEEVKQEVKYFNNYLHDPKRPSLPEHPSTRPKPRQEPPPPSEDRAPPPSQPPRDQGGYYTSPLGGGYGGSGRPPYSGGRGGGGGGGGSNYQTSPFQVRDSRPPQGDVFSRVGGPPTARPYRRSDPRPIINYTDLDAPDDGDIF